MKESAEATAESSTDKRKPLLRRVGNGLFGLSKRILDRRSLHISAIEAEEPKVVTALYDAYGFSLGDNMFAKGILDYEEEFQVKIKRRLKRWEGIDWESHIEKQDDVALKRLVRKGIPDHIRSQVWKRLLGADQIEEANIELYQFLLTKPLKETVSGDIDLDITRTFPSHRNYSQPNGTKRLRNVLHAFAIYMPSISYCQSLNYLAALLLLFLDEQDAFWCLVQIVCSKVPHRGLNIAGYYKDGMFDLRRDMRVLESILKQRLPKLYNHLKVNSIDIMSVCAEWFLCLFCISLPVPTVLRVWDALFYEGDKVLFRVAFSLFRVHEQRLLKLDSDRDLLTACKAMPKGLVQHDELLKVAFYHLPNFSRKTVWQLRQEAAEMMLKGL